MQEAIKIRGARVHNLKNIDVDIPINQITCLKGPSGSGKSSLAFHTLYSESKRRFLNSMPDSFRFFSDRPLKADVDDIHPVLPVFALAQANPVISSRSCVMDVMGITEKLQKVFFFEGQQTCSTHKVPYEEMTLAEVIDGILGKEQLDDKLAIHVLIKKDDYINLFEGQALPTRSFNSEFFELRPLETSDDFLELVRIRYKSLNTIDKKLKEIPELNDGQKLFIYHEGLSKKLLEFDFSTIKACPICGEASIDHKLEYFSPYNALGACDVCSGHGAILVLDDKKVYKDLNLGVGDGGISLFNFKSIAKFKKPLIDDFRAIKISPYTPINRLPKKAMDIIENGGPKFPGLKKIMGYLERKKYKKHVRILLRRLQKEQKCTACDGSRVCADAANTMLMIDKKGYYYRDVLNYTVDELSYFLIDLVNSRKDFNNYVKNLLKTILGSFKTSHSIGLGNLRLLKKTKKLSPGEYQRLLMVKYLSYEGSGSLFIFDEPSLGLSDQEQLKLFNGIKTLRDQGNTVLIVEHSEIFHQKSDQVIEMGEGAGYKGGEVLFTGKIKKKKISYKLDVPKKRKPNSWIKVKDLVFEDRIAKSIKFPIDAITQVKGESSSGKTNFLIKALPELIKDEVEKKVGLHDFSAKDITLDDSFNDVLMISANMGNVTSRSTVGSFLGFSPEVRKHFARLEISRKLGLDKGHFSTNTEQGRCANCEGNGKLIVEMVYLEDIHLTCEDCKGRGLKPEYANIYDGRITAWEAFSRPMDEVIPFLKLTPKWRRVWDYVKILNLNYLSLNRKLNSLSGGERQRINLLGYLTKEIRGHLIFFENLAFGLSHQELERLCHFLRRLCDTGNTIVIIDNHPIFSEIAEQVTDFTSMPLLSKA